MRILVLSPHISSRLQYLLDWLCKERLGLDYDIVQEGSTFNPADYALVLSYGCKYPNALQIPSCGYLFVKEIAPAVAWGEWQEMPVLFSSDDSSDDLPFDLFSAVFYLISRSEEYTADARDKYGRFPATESVLYKINFLHRPLIDEWLNAFKTILVNLGVEPEASPFVFLPTYDIDIAWKYLHHSFRAQLRSVAGNVLRGNGGQLIRCLNVWRGKEQDPYDAFSFLLHLHRSYPASLFMLCASRNGLYDRHVLPGHPALKKLLERLDPVFHIALHPSYHSTDQTALILQEKHILEALVNKPIHRSRQHYIRFRLPYTYRSLIDAGIREDHSMGYGTHLGFRSGTSHSFLWYDLEQEQVTELRVFPFSFMDTTAHFELRMSTKEAFAHLEEIRQRLQSVGGVLTTIFHNFSLGDDPEWPEWQACYQRFFESTI